MFPNLIAFIQNKINTTTNPKYRLGFVYVWCWVNLFMVLLGTSLTCEAQILEEDTVDIAGRYPYVQYTTDPQSMLMQNVDTSLNNFHQYSPTFINPEYEHYYLGNIGQAAHWQVFEYDKSIGFDLGTRQFDTYIYQPEDVRYFASPFPYANLKYVVGPSEEQVFAFNFSQPLSQNLRYNIDFNRIGSPGTYRNHRSSQYHGYGSVWYQSDNQRYNVLSHYLVNDVDVEQNGGVVFTGIFADTSVVKNAEPVSLSTANSRLDNRQIRVQQSYDWGKYYQQRIELEDTLVLKKLLPTQRVGHAFSYTTNRVDYVDDSPSDSFYPNIYLDSGQTNDILTYNDLQNEIFTARFGNKQAANDSTDWQRTYTAKLGLQHNFIRLTPLNNIDTALQYNSTTALYDTVYIRKNRTTNLNTVLLKFRLQNNRVDQKIQYDLRANYALLGFNITDFDIDTRLGFQGAGILGGLTGRVRFKRLTPDYLTTYYLGNHHQWDNPDFKKINSLQLEGKYNNPTIRLSIGYANHTFTNYTYWDENALPAQLDGAVNISQLTIQKDFKWRKWLFQNTLVYQLSTDERIPIPAFWSRHNFFYETNLFKGAALGQFGLNVQYNTSYFNPAYSPAVGQFHLQQTERLGTYPVMDVYANFQVKRVNLFVRYQHINQAITITQQGPDNFIYLLNNQQTGYFVAPTYAMPDRGLRLGASWKFYD